MSDMKRAEAFSKHAAQLQDLEGVANQMLVDPAIAGNAEAVRYLQSIARRSGELARTVMACCYTIAHPKKAKEAGGD